MNPAALSVRNLQVGFHGPDGPVPVVRGVDLEIGAGECVGLVGESGCGKSVTALALMGLLDGPGARVRMDALALGGDRLPPAPGGLLQARAETAAMIFQEPATALDPVFTVRWHLVRVIRRRFRVDRREALRRAEDALSSSGFERPAEVLGAYPGQLSGGMRQRVMIAMATAVEPRVLIADEATTALDVTSQQTVLNHIMALRERFGTAILLISHDLGVVARCCDRVMVMYCGRIVEQAPDEACYRRPRHPYSAALLAAVPRLAPEAPAVKSIPGQLPPPGSYVTGCAFHPRCVRAEGDCAQRRPESNGSDGRWVACHHPL